MARVRPALMHTFVGLITSEFISIPLLRLLGLHGIPWLVASIVIGTAGLSYWYWLIGTLLNRPSWFQKACLDYVQLTDTWSARYVQSSYVPLNTVLKLLTHIALHGAIVLLGMAPFGLWIVGLTYARTKGYRMGFLMILIGNALKISICTLGINFLW